MIAVSFIDVLINQACALPPPAIVAIPLYYRDGILAKTSIQLAGEHRNITQFYDVFQDDDFYYLTMGKSLRYHRRT